MFRGLGLGSGFRARFRVQGVGAIGALDVSLGFRHRRVGFLQSLLVGFFLCVSLEIHIAPST